MRYTGLLNALSLDGRGISLLNTENLDLDDLELYTAPHYAIGSIGHRGGNKRLWPTNVSNISTMDSNLEMHLERMKPITSTSSS